MPEAIESENNKIRQYNIEAHDFYSRFSDLKPREIAILGGAFLEAGLQHLLEEWLVDSSGTIFKKGALASMISRAQVARAMGCFPKSILTELITLGEIRNLFAHKYGIQDFNHPDVLDLTERLAFRSLNDASEYFKAQFDLISAVNDGDPDHPSRLQILDAAGNRLVDFDLPLPASAQIAYQNSLKITFAAMFCSVKS